MNLTCKDTLVEDVEKLRDTCVNVVPDEKLAVYYQTWVDQVHAEKITDPKLANFIKRQIDYWSQKDRKYGNYLEELLRR